MVAYPVTLELPGPVYHHFKRRAEQGRRSVEAELLAAVRSVAFEAEERLPRELDDELAGLVALDDEALWRVARSHLPREAGTRLEELNFKQKNEGLNTGEKDILAQLLYQYDRYMLLRAHAAKLLKDRGHDLSGLLDEG